MEFRSARHTNNLKLIKEFYTKIIGLKVLFTFKNHNNYSGVFIGKQDHNWYLEFTTSKNKAEHEFDSRMYWFFIPLKKTNTIKLLNKLKQTILK